MAEWRGTAPNERIYLKQRMGDNIVFQEKFPLVKNETPESLSKKIHCLEMKCFPLVIESVINSLSV